MAPLTRMRAGPGNVPTELMATHYAPGVRAREASSSPRRRPFRLADLAMRTRPASSPGSRLRVGVKITLAVHARVRTDIPAAGAGMSGRQSQSAPPAQVEGCRSLRRRLPRADRPTPIEVLRPTLCHALSNWMKFQTSWLSSGTAPHMRCRPGSTASKSTAQTATCRISSSKTAQPAHRRLWWIGSKIAPDLARSDGSCRRNLGSGSRRRSPAAQAALRRRHGGQQSNGNLQLACSRNSSINSTRPICTP